MEDVPLMLITRHFFFTPPAKKEKERTRVPLFKSKEDKGVKKEDQKSFCVRPTYKQGLYRVCVSDVSHQKRCIVCH